MGINKKHRMEYVLQSSPKNTTPKTQQAIMQILSNRLNSYGFKSKDFAIKSLLNNQISIKTKKIDSSKNFKELLTQRAYFAILEPHPAKEEILKSLLQLNAEPSPLSKLFFLSENSTHLAELAYAFAKDTTQINTYLAAPNIKSLFPKNLQFMWSRFPSQQTNNKQHFALYTIKTSGDKTFIPFNNKDILKATTKQDYTNNYVIFLNFKKTSHQKLEELTTKNIDQFILLTIDNKVYSSPKVMEKLTGGAAQISGNFSEQEAINTANILQGGCLPTNVELTSESLIERE